MNYVKKSWDDIHARIDEIVSVYSLYDTTEILKRNDFYKTLFGRAKNRTLMKSNPKLYKSIYIHSQIIEDTFKSNMVYFGSYSFTNRIKFIVERDCDITNMKCNCGQTYTWNRYCRHCPEPKKTWLGRTHTKKTKKQQRISTLKYLERTNGQLIPRYNVDSIPIIEQYGKDNGYSFQHAENGGEFHIKELGYWVDGYDVENNVVLEIDEPHHFNKDGNLKPKDIQRQCEIENLLKCKFIRIQI